MLENCNLFVLVCVVCRVKIDSKNVVKDKRKQTDYDFRFKIIVK